MLTKHVFIDKSRENFPIFNINTSNIFFTHGNLIEEVPRNGKNYSDKENKKNLNLIFSLLEEVWQSNTNIHASLSIWVSKFLEVISCFWISHNGISFCDLNEFIDGIWIIWVLIWMFLSREFSVCFFHNFDFS